MTFDATTTAADVLAGVDLTGRTAIVTGAASGIGRVSAAALARAGATVVAGVRDPAAFDLPGVEARRLDLADLAQVAAFAATVGRADILINNAGVMACPETRVGPGRELQFAVNHLGHFALTVALWPALRSGTDAVVVAVSSNVRPDAPIRWDDPYFTAGPYDRWAAYAQSKAANALFAAHLDVLGRPYGIRAASVHPGAVLTPLQRHLTRDEMVAAGWIDADGRPAEYFKTVEQGAATQLWAAVTPSVAGVHCADCAVTPFRPDPADAARLWDLSARLTGLPDTLPAPAR
ncbi:SDR family NAD(P)-dependent oxidoreductase [Dactylosporangium matsuzakiense]|uniref:Oxidoreductase n=1 Tax=Dactylosporangium matsuzakiense TaxID=53360 RepID=A0A9W6NT90_9ACTN|nr:SDR family NAD(P)-dependent oxidoreductase [Dactylosporangium matsuzakiense]UWZ47863.1 SDR family NAD(P)-dependent oxidoreductase [Dactylosporangium matsuzakiense]GLL07962.1 oxidoreductase [Dactylosporangium matsuzakiense]